MYDPLERKIPKESSDEGIKRDDLVKLVGDLKRISGKNLHMNMDNRLY
jgi:hypothetical protein